MDVLGILAGRFGIVEAFVFDVIFAVFDAGFFFDRGEFVAVLVLSRLGFNLLEFAFDVGAALLGQTSFAQSSSFATTLQAD